MNNGRKTLLRIILFFILFIPAYFAAYNIWIMTGDNFSVENTTKVEILDIEGNLLAEYTDRNDIKSFIKTLDSATSVSTVIRPLEYEKPLILMFYKGEKTFTYGMYLSLENTNDCIIKTFDGNLLHMQQTDAEKILNTPLSDILYPNNNLPVAKLIQGEDSYNIYPRSGEWELRKPDGNYYISTVPNFIKESNAAKAYQNRAFDIRFGIEPDILKVEVKEGKEIIFSDIYSNFTEQFTCDTVKDLEYIVTAEWYQKEETDFYGNATYVFDVKYFVPAKFDISQIEAVPGEIVAVTAYNMTADDKLNIITDVDLGFEPKFVSFGANRVSLIPISRDLAGKKINLTVTSEVNEPIIYHIKINESAESSLKKMTANDENVAKHLTAAAQAGRLERYNAIFGAPSGINDKYWTEKFILPGPNPDKIWIGYGWRVMVNGGNEYINEGLNVDIDPGDPVKAANTGRVLFAAEVPMDGNLIVIDHGMGVKTWYAHMGTLNVKVGDSVMKGQQIGIMDRYTGLYTDLLYNLYFAVSVNNVFVNPAPVIADGIPGIDIVNTGINEADMPEAAAEDVENNG